MTILYTRSLFSLDERMVFDDESAIKELPDRVAAAIELQDVVSFARAALERTGIGRYRTTVTCPCRSWFTPLYTDCARSNHVYTPFFTTFPFILPSHPAWRSVVS